MIKYTARNGFTRPYHSLQILSWVILLILTGTFYSLTLPPLCLQMQILSGISYTIILIFTCTFGYKVTSIDPIDPAVKTAFNSQISGVELDLTELTKFCRLCKVHVHSSSMHCRLCKRCVIDVDHHWKYVNNCIGKKNYRHFIGTVLSLLGLIAIQILSSIYLLIAMDNDWEEKENIRKMFGHDKIAIWIIVILSSFIFMIDGLLLGFHVWLISHNLSNYQYFLLNRTTTRG